MRTVIRIEVDEDATVTSVDAAAVDLLGAGVLQRIGHPLAEFVNSTDRPRLARYVDGSGDRGDRPDASVVVRLLDDHGRSVWVDLAHDGDGDDDPDRTTSVGTVLRARPFRRVQPLAVDASDPDPYHALVQRSADIVMVVTPEGTVQFVNTAMLRLLGMEPDDLTGTQVLDLIHPDDHDAVTDVVVQLLEDPSRPCAFEFRARHVDGTYRWLDGWLQNLLDHPHVGGLLGNGRDVTDRHLAQVALAASEERFRSLASSSPSAIFELDAKGVVRFANDRWRAVTGRSVAEPHDLFSVLLPDDADRLRALWLSGADRTGIDEHVCVVRTDGGVRWVELHTRPVHSGEEFVTTHVGTLHDVTDVHHAHAELEYLASHDPLTDLPNRTLLLERLRGAVEAIGGSDHLLALLFVDLDRFKVVNDSLGHHAGDRVLVTVAGRLVDLVRPDDVVARFGGDEFVVLCAPISEPDQAIGLADRIRREVSGGVEVDGETVHVSVSVGVVIGTGESSPEALLRDADAAMYTAKTKGRDRAQVFDDAMHRAAMERLSVEAGLRRGLERSEFRLVYQPIVDVASGGIEGFEALVRWEHPERGLLEPVEFLAVAEESGLVRDLGTWILDRACRDGLGWPPLETGEAPALYVNLAAGQIASRHLVATVARLVADTGIDVARLVLEVTEGMLMTDPDETAEMLAMLRGSGARIAIDDFGTGYSSLSYLTRLPIDVLKIDQSFVAGLATSPKDRKVTGAIIELAHALGLATVAEGVEEPGQLEALGELGCDLAQGFLLSPPVPAAEVPGRCSR